MFGDIFLAKARDIRDVEPETLVVVKSLLMKDEHLFFEFRQEMEMYSKLDHPFIVKLLGVCREVEPHFMILEYCDWVRKLFSICAPTSLVQYDKSGKLLKIFSCFRCIANLLNFADLL